MSLARGHGVRALTCSLGVRLGRGETSLSDRPAAHGCLTLHPGPLRAMSDGLILASTPQCAVRCRPGPAESPWDATLTALRAALPSKHAVLCAYLWLPGRSGSEDCRAVTLSVCGWWQPWGPTNLQVSPRSGPEEIS